MSAELGFVDGSKAMDETSITDLYSCQKLAKEKGIKQKEKQIKRNYRLFIIGVCLVYAGYCSYLILQSSIHIENGLGTMKIAVNC